MVRVFNESKKKFTLLVKEELGTLKCLKIFNWPNIIPFEDDQRLTTLYVYNFQFNILKNQKYHFLVSLFFYY